MKRRIFLQATPALISMAPIARSQTGYPSKPIRYIVPVATGGGSDMVGRTVTERWAKVLGQSIVVENQGGGGGVIASQNTVRATPDGYTLMQGYVATHGTAPATRKLPYDPVRSFTPIGMIGSTPNVIVVNDKVPATTVGELIDYIRKNPGRSNYGSAGAGSLTHLSMELLKQETKLFITHIAYRGIAPAFVDLIAGQTQVMMPGLAAALPHIRTGRVRPLAVTGIRRHSALTDVPTLEEVGYAGFDAVQWYGVVGPAGIPPEIVRRLSETLATVLKAPDLRDKLSVEAVEPMLMSPEQFGRYITEDVARWSRLAQSRGIQLDG